MVRRGSAAQLRRNVIESLRKDLTRLLVLEEEGIRIEVVALVQLASEPTHVTDFKKHLARQFALNRKVDVVVARVKELRVVKERQQLAKGLVRYDRRCRCHVDRHRNVPVDSNAEWQTSPILWTEDRKRLRKADSEHRYDDRRNG